MKNSLLIIAVLLISAEFILPQKVGDTYRFNINNLNIPMNRIGTIADVNIPPWGSEAIFGNGTFLYSSGFMISGYTNDTLWACGQASASLLENMVPGTVESGPNDPNAVIYVIKKNDEPFGQSWQDWIDAVALGADFYDGNGDGIYDPVDLNGNNQWDANEDAPDLLGDETAWCVYNDGVIGRSRFLGVPPQGIEFRQTMFASSELGDEGNIVFLRYRISNSGSKAESLDSVIFSVWADPDLGETFDDDLVGVDVQRNAGFTFNTAGSPDPAYGLQIPSFFIDFLSGPVSYIPGMTFLDLDSDGIYTEGLDVPLDTAYSYRGQLLGIKEFPGAKNLEISSFVHYIQSDPLRGDPQDEYEERNYSSGRLRLGQLIDPCDDANGVVLGGVDCTTIDPFFWYSGDPVNYIGWINSVPSDQRQMTNVGPFSLRVGQQIDIIVAYVVGQGSIAINSVIAARNISDIAQTIYDSNFDFPVGIDDNDVNQFPDKLRLYQNYPNPFNPKTTINFSVPDNEFVSLKVYDVLGNEIATLVNEEKSAGVYMVEFNLESSIKNPASGIYIYQLRAGNYLKTKKMVLMK